MRFLKDLLGYVQSRGGRGLFIFFFMFSAGILGHADVLVDIAFSNSTQSAVGDPVFGGNEVDDRISLSSFTDGSGLIAYQLQTAGTNSGEMAGDGTFWLGQSAGTSVGDLAGAVASNAYVEFTLSSDNPVQLTRLSFTVGGYGSVSTGYVTLRSDAEAIPFQTDLGTFSSSMNAKSEVKSVELGLNPDFFGRTNVTFRIYLYDAYVGNNNRRAGFDDLKVEGTVLTAPVLVHPADNEDEPLSIPYFDWEDVVSSPYPGSYEIEIDTNITFSSPLDVDRIPALVSCYSPDFELESEVEYYWRVKYLSDDGSVVLVSATNRFSIASPHVIDVWETDGWSEIRSKLQSAITYTSTNNGCAELRFRHNEIYNVTQQHDAADDETDYLFYLNGAEDIIINGRGSKIVLTLDSSGGNDQCGFFLARGSERVQIKDFKIDYARDSIRQFGGQVTVLDKTNRTFTVEVDTNVYANLYEASLETNGFFLDQENLQRIGFKGVAYGMLQSWGDALVDADTFEFTAETSTWGRYQEELEVGDYFVSEGRGGDLIILFNNVTDFVANDITAYGCRGRYYILRKNVLAARCINNDFLRTGGRLLGAPSGGVNDHGGMSWYENVRIEHTRDDSFHCGEADTNGDELVLRNSEIDTAFRHSIWVQTDRSWVTGNYVENAGISSMRLGPNGPPEEGTNGHLLVSALIQDNLMVAGRRNGIISYGGGGSYPDAETGRAVNENIQIVSNAVVDLQSDEAFLLQDLQDSVVVGNLVISADPTRRIYHDSFKDIGFFFTNSINVTGEENWVDDIRINPEEAVVVSGLCTNIDLQAWALTNRFEETWSGLTPNVYTQKCSLAADNNWSLSPENFPVAVVSNSVLDSEAFGRVVGTVTGDATAVDTHTAEISSAIDPCSVPVRFRVSAIFEMITGAGRAESRFGIRNSDADEIYEITFNNNTNACPFSVQVNNASFDVGSAGDQSLGGIWDVDVTLSRIDNNSTQLDYTVFRNGDLYVSGSEVLGDAVSLSAFFEEAFLQFRQRALIVFDDLLVFSYASGSTQ